MSNIFFCSDTHFGHSNIIKYSNRPFADANEMNEEMIRNWNAIVKPGDRVFHLGDYAFMSYHDLKTLTRRLNGQKELILGNHDKTIIQNWDDLLDKGLFHSIQYYYELKVNRQHIVLFHYGQRVWNRSHHGSIHLYGHSHGSLPPFGKSVDVGVDCKEITSEYRPISLDEVLKYMETRTFQAVDHHDTEQ